jgi:DNA-binding XRE family transcriptional regulator
MQRSSPEHTNTHGIVPRDEITVEECKQRWPARDGVEVLDRPADLVRTHRERLGLTQQELARALGLNPRTIDRWERGEFAPHWIWLARLEEMVRNANRT